MAVALLAGFGLCFAGVSATVTLNEERMSDVLMDQVTTALAKVKRIPKESIAPDATLESLKMDSLDTITLLFELEEVVGVTISDEQARTVRTVRDIVEGIRRLKDAAAASSSAGAPAVIG